MVMAPTDTDGVEAALSWRAGEARHVDRYFVSAQQAMSCAPLARLLRMQQNGTPAREWFEPGQLVPGFAAARIHDLPRSRFKTAPRPGMRIEPRLGRFYPARFLHGGLPGIDDVRTPFRVMSLDEVGIRVDANHPLATYDLELAARSMHCDEYPEPRRVREDALEALTGNGPGMQALRDQEPDFYSEGAFAREDAGDDRAFYGEPRLVQHIDRRAREAVRSLYGRFMEPGTRVLDLMTSWVSHLPEDRAVAHVAGLGLNQVELDRNPQLDERRVHDLNRAPSLPWPAAAFDLAVCTVSVEYLISPVEVFKEIGRVLKPGGHFVVTFSDRWFPTKAIRIWSELHPFERMSLVLSYLRRSSLFTALHTESWRGWPRPNDDPYAGQLDYSDPVFAVWGRRV